MAATRARTRRGTAKTMMVGAGIIVALVAINVRFPSLLAMAELKAFDLRLYARGVRKPLGTVAIAAIDELSIERLGRWPWPRTTLARLVSALADYQAAVIGFDMVMSEPDSADSFSRAVSERLKRAGVDDASLASALGPGNDQVFADAIKAHGSTLMGYALETEEPSQQAVSAGFSTSLSGPDPIAYGLVREPPGTAPPVPTAQAYLPNIPPIASAARGSAYVNVSSDADEIIRTETLVTRFQSRYYAPLTLALISVSNKGTLLYLTLEQFGVADVTVGSIDVPCDESGRMLINYRGPVGTFPHYSVADIIEHKVPREKLAGKIVLVGATARGVGDRWSTPMGDDFPGVEIHANAIDNILTGDFIQRSGLTRGLETVAAVVLGLAASLAAAMLPALWCAVSVSLMGAGYFALSQWLLVREGLMVGVLFPLLSLGITYSTLASYRYLTEGLEKRYLRRAFEYYLHPEVIQSLIENPETLKLGGERRHLSVMFTDILNFTARAERSDAQELVSVLNTYMTAMIEHVLQSGGVLDKLMGDGLMAFWGAPGDIANPARAAIECALEMLVELGRLRQHDSRFADFDIGIGIATGDAIVGNFGGRQRFNYSVVGDTANLASRLEGLTRHFRVHLVVDHATYTEAAGSYVAREIGLVRVKGKAQPVRIVEVAGRERDGLDREYFSRFSEAVAMMPHAAPELVRERLEELARDRPDDHVMRMHLQRLHGAKSAVPIFEFDTK